ncbi:MAG: NAD(P)H-binding protein, partial [Streptosporangiaceae bacterium]
RGAWLMASPLRCLVTGASGYIGGRLVPELLAAGYGVRCMARDRGKLAGRSWSGDVEVAVADAMDGAAVRRDWPQILTWYDLVALTGNPVHQDPAAVRCRLRDRAGREHAPCRIRW